MIYYIKYYLSTLYEVLYFSRIKSVFSIILDNLMQIFQNDVFSISSIVCEKTIQRINVESLLLFKKEIEKKNLIW